MIELVKISEAARLLSVGPATAYRWLAAGKLGPAFGQYPTRVRIDALEAHIGPLDPAAVAAARTPREGRIAVRRHRTEKVERRARALLRRYLVEEIDQLTRGYVWADRRIANIEDGDDPQIPAILDAYGSPYARCKRLNEMLVHLRQCEQPPKAFG